ncbi:hypothetical protein ABE137_16525 [Brevibacillus laterosporus]|nr:hypothetical protein J5TS2_03150 [Brevibacillus halotolerans]
MNIHIEQVDDDNRIIGEVVELWNENCIETAECTRVLGKSRIKQRVLYYV